MATEDVSILRVDTGEAVKSINDLKENIKLLKGNLGELNIGSQEYQDTLEELTINQNALKNAMHATSASMEDVVAAAASMNVEFDEQNKLINKGKISYNELVHTMAALKEEWRATTDEARRSELGERINEINSQLKEMDASTGNFSRNVGNYESGFAGIAAKFDKWGETLKQMPPTLGAAKEQIGKVGETMQLVGKQPILGIIGLLAPIIMKITSALKDNETAMDAVKKLMASLQPVFDVVNFVLEKIAQGFAKVVEFVVEFITKAEPMKKITSTISGIGNAILQYLLIPIKTAVAAFKGLGKIIGDVFKGEWGEIKTHAKETGQEIADAYKEGFSLKSNFNEGKKKGEDFINGVQSNTEKAKSAGAEVAAAFQEGYDEELARIRAENAEFADAERANAEEEAYFEQQQAELEAQEEFQKKQNDLFWKGLHERFDAKAEAAQKEADLEKAVQDGIDEYQQEQAEKQKKREEEKKKAAIDSLNAIASATSSILNGIADMYEQDGENSKKNQKKIKALRIAAATIDMIQGAVTAFSSAMQLGPIAGPIVGAVNAAAVTTMGLVNIAKIKNTNLDSDSNGGGGTPSVVSAPKVDASMPTIRTATSASEEERLNRMAAPQKVYILQSDIEAAGSQSKAQIKESSF